MNRTDLAELIHNGESSGVELKRDDVHPERLAKEMAALLNLEGGHILLGVEKDQTISGLTREREKAEEWVMEVARGEDRRDRLAAGRCAGQALQGEARFGVGHTDESGDDFSRRDGRRRSATPPAVGAFTVRPQAGSRSGCMFAPRCRNILRSAGLRGR